MHGLADRSWFLLAVAAYGISTLHSIFLWRKGFQKDDRVAYLLLLAGLALQTTAMGIRGASLSRCPVGNLYEAILFVNWTTVVSCLLMGLAPRFRSLGVFVSPLVFCLGVFALMPDLDSQAPQAGPRHVLLSLHASLSLLAYGAFGLAAMAAAMYLYQQHDLKFQKVRAALALLPPIERLAKTTRLLVEVGVALLTAGLAIGFVWLKREQGVYLKADAKIFWSVFVWCAYLAMLVLRRLRAHSSRHFSWAVLAAFGFLVLTFWGFNMLSTIHNP